MRKLWQILKNSGNQWVSQINAADRRIKMQFGQPMVRENARRGWVKAEAHWVRGAVHRRLMWATAEKKQKTGSKGSGLSIFKT